MAILNSVLVVDVTSQRLVQDFAYGNAQVLPAFTVGDTVSLMVKLVRLASGGVNPQYSIVNPSSLSLKVGLGVAGTAPVAQQVSFSTSGDYFVGVLDLAVGGFDAAVNAGTALVFEIEVGEGGQYSTVYQAAATTRKQVNSTSISTPTPAEEFLTRAECLALFAQFVNSAGRTITLTSPDGAFQRILGVNNDGSAQDDILPT